MPNWPGCWPLLDEMMETAGRHAEILGVGVRDLHAKGLTWVLARLHVKVGKRSRGRANRAHRHLALGPAAACSPCASSG